MFGQNHQSNQNVFLNGAHGHQRFGMQMNASKPFQPGQHHQGHGQPRQQQDYVMQGQNTNMSSHQHNTSASGFSTAASQFHANSLRNSTPNHPHNGLEKPPHEQWTQQLTLAQQSRETTGTHPHARNHPSTKSITSTAMNSGKRDTDREDRHRATMITDSDRHTWDELDLGGQGLRALSPALFQYSFLKKLFLNGNKLTFLLPGIGRLRNLSHLDLSQNLLSDLPAEMGMLVQLKSLLLFDNHLETLPSELGSLYQLEMLGVDGNPLNEDIKTILMEEGTKALITWLQESAEIPEPPAERDWIIVDESRATTSAPQADRFSVLSFNTLGHRYASQQYYGYTPLSALAWDHRRDVILEEIRARDADILCLQEIVTETYHDFFRPMLAHDDYKGIYWPRARAKTMGDKEAKQVDGCAIFFKNARYILLEKDEIDLSYHAIQRSDIKGEHDMFNRVMPRDHIAVVAFLENRLTGARLVVTTIHTYWDHAYSDVKVVQTAVLMEQLTKLCEKYAKIPACKDKAPYRFAGADTEPDGSTDAAPQAPPPEPGPSQEYAKGTDLPLLICGDFNSRPDSGVVELIATGSLRGDHPELRGYQYGNFTRDGMSHPFSLKSAYGNIGELSFTNYTPGFIGVIDYIWYSTSQLQVTGLLGEVDKKYLQKVPGFPNYHFPSDHLLLLSEFVMKPRRDQRKTVEPDFGPQRLAGGGGGAAGAGGAGAVARGERAQAKAAEDE